MSNTFFAFADHSNGPNPGWPLRIFLAALLDFCPDLSKTTIQVIGITCSKSGSLASSHIYSITVPEVSIVLQNKIVVHTK